MKIHGIFDPLVTQTTNVILAPTEPVFAAAALTVQGGFRYDPPAAPGLHAIAGALVASKLARNDVPAVPDLLPGSFVLSLAGKVDSVRGATQEAVELIDRARASPDDAARELGISTDPMPTRELQQAVQQAVAAGAARALSEPSQVALSAALSAAFGGVGMGCAGRLGPTVPAMQWLAKASPEDRFHEFRTVLGGLGRRHGTAGPAAALVATKGVLEDAVFNLHHEKVAGEYAGVVSPQYRIHDQPLVLDLRHVNGQLSEENQEILRSILPASIGMHQNIPSLSRLTEFALVLPLPPASTPAFSAANMLAYALGGGRAFSAGGPGKGASAPFAGVLGTVAGLERLDATIIADYDGGVFVVQGSAPALVATEAINAAVNALCETVERLCAVNDLSPDLHPSGAFLAAAQTMAGQPCTVGARARPEEFLAASRQRLTAQMGAALDVPGTAVREAALSHLLLPVGGGSEWGLAERALSAGREGFRELARAWAGNNKCVLALVGCGDDSDAKKVNLAQLAGRSQVAGGSEPTNLEQWMKAQFNIKV